MSIALGRNSDSPGLIRGIPCISAYDSLEIGAGRRFPQAAAARGEEEEDERDSASCSSSIGRNSDCSGGSADSDGVDSGEPEVQSALKGPLDTMDALEASLPIRRGMSKFYCGKSRSFASLADVSSSSSAKDLAKQENAYTRKRKNLLPVCGSGYRRHSDPPSGVRGSTLKRPANSRRSMLSPVSGRSSSNSNSMEVEYEQSQASQHRPPRHPIGAPLLSGASPSERRYFPARSFSLADLQAAPTCRCSFSPNSPTGMD